MHYYQKLADVFIYGKNIIFFFRVPWHSALFFTIWLTAERQEETGRDLIGWLHVIDRRFIQSPSQFASPCWQPSLGCKTLRSNLTSARWKSLISNNNNNTKTEKKKTKHFVLFVVSAVGELMFLWFVSHLMVKWLGQRALAAFPRGLGCGEGGGSGASHDPVRPRGGRWRLTASLTCRCRPDGVGPGGTCPGSAERRRNTERRRPFGCTQ